MARTMENATARVAPVRTRRQEAATGLATTRFHEAIALLKKRQWAEAEPVLRGDCAQPRRRGFLVSPGADAQGTGAGREAEAPYLRAIELKPIDYRIYNDLGLCYWQQNRPDLAVPCYTKGVEYHPQCFDAP